MNHDYRQYIDNPHQAMISKDTGEKSEGFHHKAVCKTCGWQTWWCLRSSASRARDGHKRYHDGHEVRLEEIDDWEELARELCSDGEDTDE